MEPTKDDSQDKGERQHPSTYFQLTPRQRRELAGPQRPVAGRFNGRPSAIYGSLPYDYLTSFERSQDEHSHSSAPTQGSSSSAVLLTHSRPGRVDPYPPAAIPIVRQYSVSSSLSNTSLDGPAQHPGRMIASPELQDTTTLEEQPDKPQITGAMPSSTPARPEASDRNTPIPSSKSSTSSSATPTSPAVSNSTLRPARNTNPASQASATSARAYIAETGDPLLAVEKLLNENSNWRALAEKQRASMLSMQEDFGKVCSQRDRYMSRLKDIRNAERNTVPAVPAVSEAIEKNGLRDTIANDSNAGAGEFTNPLGAISKSTEALSSPTHSRDALVQRKASEGGTTGHVKTPHSAGSPAAERGALYQDQAVQSYAPLSASSSAIKPSSSGQTLSSPGEKSRKAAPAPLNLSQTNSPTYRPSQTPTSINSGSDYGDGLSSGRTPELDRGRRRTRQEDDQDREALAMVEEARTHSNESSKSSKGKGKAKARDASEEGYTTIPKRPTLREAQAARDVAPAKAVGIGLPSSPKAALNGGVPSVGSIASALAPEPSYPSYPYSQNDPQTGPLQPKSPGLPLSPRPGDRPINAPLPRLPTNDFPAPGPVSPRQGLPLSPRAPKYPIPLPPSASVPNFPTSSRVGMDSTSMAERLQSGLGRSTLKESPSISSATTLNPDQEIFKGFVPSEHPELLVSPRSLSLITTKVFSSRLRPARNSIGNQKENENDMIFTLAITSKSDGSHLWWLEKRPAALTTLDHSLRSNMNLPAAVPDRGLFSGHSPAKLDARRASIDQYFDSMFSSPMGEKAAMHVCKFLSTDVIAPDPDQRPMSPEAADPGPSSPRLKPRKEGFLSKKGSKFGGWKERYFILEDGQLRHLESPNGALLGNIRLQNAAISRATGDVGEDAEYRHAFTVHEPKRRDANSHIRHILCAESDEERDAWVNALMQHVGGEQPTTSPPTSPMAARTPSFNTQRPTDFPPPPQRSQGSVDSPTAPPLQAIPYSDTVAADAPKIRTPTTGNGLTQSPIIGQPPSANSPAYPNISGPVGGGPIQDSHAWGNKAPSPTRRDREMKKRSVFGFMRSSDDPGTPSSARAAGRGISPRPPVITERRNVRGVFGVPLAEAAEFSQPVGIDVCLPSPVYRCIEYLEAKEAWKDEGLFRVGGSNVMIQALKERFDTEGDVNLLDGKLLDVNAIASLLKRYLRELPETMLTNKLHSSFMQLLDIDDTRHKLAAMNLLVHKLPEANFDLLFAVFQFLIKVASHTDTNKMSIKNINIVFSPTINIPSPLITLFITEYDSIFTPSVVDEATASPILESLSSFPIDNMSIDAAGAHHPAPASTPLNLSSASASSLAAQQARMQTATPPPRELDGSYQGTNNPSLALPQAHSSASSSPSSLISGTGATQGRKTNRRESSMLGSYGSNGVGGGFGLGIGGNPGGKGLELPSGPPAEGAKRKSSYTRLREGITGGRGVRE